MGQSWAKLMLWQPQADQEEVSLGQASRDWLMSDEFDVWLKDFFGYSYKFRSWSYLKGVVEQQRERIASKLTMELAALEKATPRRFSVENVALEVLQGSINPDSSMFSMCEPQVTLRMNHEGRVYSQTTINSSGTVANPRPPSLAELGIQQQLEAKQQAANAQGSTSYALRISQTYCFTHYSPPRGRQTWESELVYLHFDLRPFQAYVVQIEISDSDVEGSLQAFNMAGELLLERSCRTDIDDLLQALASAAGRPADTLRLTFPDGALVHGEDPPRGSLDDFLQQSLQAPREPPRTPTSNGNGDDRTELQPPVRPGMAFF